MVSRPDISPERHLLIATLYPGDVLCANCPTLRVTNNLFPHRMCKFIGAAVDNISGLGLPSSSA